MRLIPHHFNQIYERVFSDQIKEYIPPDVKPHVFFLRITGAWPSKNRSFLYIMLTIAYFSLIGILFPMSQFINIFYAVSIDEAMDFSFLSVACWGPAFKMFVMYSQQENIRKLFRMHEDMMRGNRSDELFSQITRNNVNMFKFFLSLYLATWAAVVIQIIFSKPENGAWASTSHLPHEFAKDATVYLTVLVYQIIGNFSIIIWTAIVDTYPIALIILTCGHVSDLKTRLRNLGKEYPLRVDKDKKFYDEVIDCCKRYEQSLRFD